MNVLRKHSTINNQKARAVSLLALLLAMFALLIPIRATAQDYTSNLIGHWAMDDGSGLTAADSAGSNAGTLTNMDAATDWVAGQNNTALSFDGTDDFIDIPGLSLNTNTLTITAWINKTDTSYAGILYTRGGGSQVSGLDIDNGRLGYNWNDDSNAWSWTGGPIVPVNEWVFVAMSLNASQADFYVIDLDGNISTGTRTLAHAASNMTNWRIGDDDCCGNRHFDGMIDEVRIYNRALTSADIQALYEFSNQPDITTGLIRHWTMDEAPGTTDVTESVGGYNGTLFNADTNTVWVPGQVRQAVHLDGVNDRILFADHADLEFADRRGTFSAWINIDSYGVGSTQNIRNIVTNESGAGSGENVVFRLGSQESSGLRQRLGFTIKPALPDYHSNSNLPLGVWTHVAVTLSPTEVKFYIDGVLDNTRPMAGSPTSGLKQWAIGGFNRPFDGMIDDLRIYNRTLTAAEIVLLTQNIPVFAEPVPPPDPLAPVVACSNPVAEGGVIMYNRDLDIMQYCDGIHWVSMDPFYYPAEGVTFDGANDYLSAASLSNVPSSKLVTGSLWFRANDIASDQVILGSFHTAPAGPGTAGDFNVTLTAAGAVVISGTDSDNNPVLSASSSAGLDDGEWHHVMWSFDMADSGSRHLYVDGVSDLSPTTYNDADITFQAALTDGWYIGDNNAGTARFDGDLADMWIDFGSYIDLSDAGARSRFYNADKGVPVYMGPEGRLPNIYPPDIYFQGPLAGWATNKGTGGAFSVTGTLTAAAKSPRIAPDDPCHPYNDPAVGQQCDDGTYFVGDSPDGTIPMYVAPCRVGQTWGGASCTGVATGLTWNNGSTDFTVTGITDPNDGDGNTRALAAIGSEDDGAPYLAAQACNDYTAQGHADWYLPALNELNILIANTGTIGSNLGWSSTEIDDRFAESASTEDKDFPYFARCVRKGSAGACTNPSAPAGTLNYDENNHMLAYCNGENWMGITPAGDGDAGEGCANPPGEAGVLFYNANVGRMMFCEGDEWVQIGSEGFTSTWDTRNISAGSTPDDRVALPLHAGGTYDFVVYWGDGRSDHITAWDQAETMHTYDDPGEYTITIHGTIEGIQFGSGSDHDKILEISQWGDLTLINGDNFRDTSNLDIVTTDAPDIGAMTSMANLFRGSGANPDFINWDFSNITSFDSMFQDNPNAEPVTTTWDVSQATSFQNMFAGATSANPDISLWDVSNAGNLSGMFDGATAANPDISRWDISSVTDMSRMFQNSGLSTPDFTGWEPADVTDMTDFLGGIAISSESYTDLLKALEDFAAELFVTLGGGNSKYCMDQGEDSRLYLTDSILWTVTDGGLDTTCGTPPANAFISTWNTNNTTGGSTANNQIRLPLYNGGTYNFTVYWGDGNVSEVTSWDDPDRTHTYAAPGAYQLVIFGTLTGWSFNNGGDRAKIIDVSSWGTFNPGNGPSGNGGAFYGASNLDISATDVMDITGVTTLNSFFRGTSNMGPIDLSGWNTVNILDMSHAFRDSSIRPDVSNWNTSNVTHFAGMFYNNDSANPDVSNWDTSSATTLDSMFMFAGNLNPDVSNWDTSSVQSIRHIFFDSDFANPDVTNWDVSNVTDAFRAFMGAPAPDLDLSQWNAPNVTTFFEFLRDTDPLESEMYSEFLINLEAANQNNSLSFHGGDAQFCLGPAAVARQRLISDHNWSITDGGLDVTCGSLTGDVFISRWNTNNTSSGSSNADQIRLPLYNGGTYDFTVFWGDGSSDRVTAWDDPDKTHTYASAGEYTIYIIGTLNGWSFNNSGDKEKILEIINWGTFNPGNGPGDVGAHFYGASNMDITASDAPDLTGVTTLMDSFRSTSSLTNPDFSSWDTSGILSMERTFRETGGNPAISSWDLSSVTVMQGMFFEANNANPDVSTWDVSNVENMFNAFKSAGSAAPNVSNWDTSSVTNMTGMFEGASIANPNIENWDFSSVQLMQRMFENSGLNSPNFVTFSAASATDMTDMFEGLTLGSPDYSLLLQRIEATNTQDNVTLGAGNSRYCVGDAAAAKAALINDHNWTITDGGIDQSCGAWPGTVFISRWDTTNISTGSSNDDQIALPLHSGGTYDFTVFWGDGEVGRVTSWNDPDATHTYASQGIYTIIIDGTIEGFGFDGDGDRLKIQDISQWGNLRLLDGPNGTGGHFFGTNNLDITANDVLDTSGVTTMDVMFSSSGISLVEMSSWDTSNVTSMERTFFDAPNANPGVQGWDTSNVTTMALMFSSATSANPNVASWDTSSVTDMSGMFWGASSADPSVREWDVSNVTTFANMFRDADSADPDVEIWNLASAVNIDGMFFGTAIADPDTTDWNTSNIQFSSGVFRLALTADPDVSDWDTSGMTNMAYMFAGTPNANPEVYNWDVTNVTDLSYMFSDTGSAQPAVSLWDTRNVVSMEGMFMGADVANPAVSNFDTRSLTTTRNMFRDTLAANPSMSPVSDGANDLEAWILDTVTDMSGMFAGAQAADLDESGIGVWNVSNVTDMSHMFDGALLAVPNIRNWNVSSVTDMSYMFANAPLANPNTRDWNMSSVTNFENMFQNSNLSSRNYSGFLDAAENSNPYNNIDTFDSFVGVNYCQGDGQVAHIILSGRGWIFNDAGLDTGCVFP